MAGATTPDNLFFPTVGDVATPRAESTMLADSVQAALLKRQVYSFRWNTTLDMNAQTGMRYGDLGYNAETNLSMIYNTNNQWGKLGGEDVPGSYLIRPTSVAGATINADGSVSPIAAQTVFSLNGVFSSRFRAYKIVTFFDFSVASAAGFRLRATGVDAVTNYQSGKLYTISAASPGASDAVSTGFEVVPSAATQHYISAELIHPADSTLGKRKMFLATARGVGGSTYVATTGSSLQNDTVAYDGLSLYSYAPATSFGVLSWVKVYGLS